jgi:hypothetical protein
MERGFKGLDTDFFWWNADISNAGERGFLEHGFKGLGTDFF